MQTLADANRTLIKEFFEAGSRGDFDRVLEIMAPDIVIRQPPFLPYGGTYIGRDAFPALAAKMTQYIDMKNARLVHLVAGPDVSFAVQQVTDIRTGRDCLMCVQMTIRHGQLVETQVFYHEVQSLLEANGA
jgi:ketosteroid isomerase-like protein